MNILEKNVEYKRWANGSREEEPNGKRMWEDHQKMIGKESDDEQAGRNKK